MDKRILLCHNYRELRRLDPDVTVGNAMAYASSKDQRQQKREAILEQIAQGQTVQDEGKKTYCIAGVRVHTRYCERGVNGRFAFNINPNTLKSDYELWICGTGDDYYLIPIRTIKAMYDRPTAYPDKHHHEIRVLNVDVDTHLVSYAAHSLKRDFSHYYRAKLRYCQ